MALTITNDCINCDMCEPECPNKAIYLGTEVYEIDANKCTECVGHYDEAQCVTVCPIDCVIPDKHNNESADQLMAKFKRLHP